jgi:hypothetical protein
MFTVDRGKGIPGSAPRENTAASRLERRGLLAWIVMAAGRIVSCEIRNAELKEDLRDIAAQNSAK